MVHYGEFWDIGDPFSAIDDSFTKGYARDRSLYRACARHHV